MKIVTRRNRIERIFESTYFDQGVKTDQGDKTNFGIKSQPGCIENV